MCTASVYNRAFAVACKCTLTKFHAVSVLLLLYKNRVNHFAKCELKLECVINVDHSLDGASDDDGHYGYSQTATRHDKDFNEFSLPLEILGHHQCRTISRDSHTYSYYCSITEKSKK